MSPFVMFRPVLSGVRRRLCLSLVLLTTIAAAQPLHAEDATRPGDRLIAAYFQAEAAKLRDACLAEVKTLAGWESQRPELRRRLLEMLGLDPMPERTPLHPVVTGTIEHEGIVVERLHFQSLPGLYVTANLYRPSEQPGPLPAVLYLCGHSQVKQDGVNFGNKMAYHHHPVWFARNGYVCLAVDTLQLGEIEGIHHSLKRYNRWWWYARGYAPAGVETWTAIRALDYLEGRPEVDRERIGATGRSGGGGYTWYVTALDNRVKAAVPVAGISDLQNVVGDGVVASHCDCMFFVNTYRWDYPMLAALAAPRPLLILNSDKDRNHPLDGIVRIHRSGLDIYGLYNAEENLGLEVTQGAHEDTPELQHHAFGWLNRHLKQDDSPITEAAERVFEPEQLRVFTTLPADEINTRLDEVFVARAPAPRVPESSEEWGKLRDRWLAELKSKTFGGWPAEGAPLNTTSGPAWERDGLAFRTLDFLSEEPFRLRLYLVGPSAGAKENGLKLTVLGEADWAPSAAALAIDQTGEPLASGPPSRVENEFAEQLDEIRDSGEPVVFVAPRGVGPTAWTGDDRQRINIRRSFMLLGQTLDGMRVWDVRRAIATVRSLERFRDAPITLSGKDEAAALALYAALFEPDLAHLVLTAPPRTHTQEPIFLNILKVLDVPQGVALAAERTPLMLRSADPATWRYAAAVAERLGWPAGRLTLLGREDAVLYSED